MDDNLFDDLVESIKQAGAIKRGEIPYSRIHSIDSLEVKNIREKIHFSQREFASLLGISPRTLQQWEQGRRNPNGAARVLLEVANTHPEALLDTIKKLQPVSI
jgi:putative transcriptional regulator